VTSTSSTLASTRECVVVAVVARRAEVHRMRWPREVRCWWAVRREQMGAAWWSSTWC